MSAYAKPLEILIDELGRLPGIGPKSAQRIAFHLLKVDRVDAQRLADAVVDLKDKVAFCETCFNVSEGPTCGICTDPAEISTSCVSSRNRRTSPPSRRPVRSGAGITC